MGLINPSSSTHLHPPISIHPSPSTHLHPPIFMFIHPSSSTHLHPPIFIHPSPSTHLHPPISIHPQINPSAASEQDIKVACAVLGTLEYVDGTLPALVDTLRQHVSSDYHHSLDFDEEQDQVGYHHSLDFDEEQDQVGYHHSLDFDEEQDQVGYHHSLDFDEEQDQVRLSSLVGFRRRAGPGRLRTPRRNPGPTRSLRLRPQSCDHMLRGVVTSTVLWSHAMWCATSQLAWWSQSRVVLDELRT